MTRSEAVRIQKECKECMFCYMSYSYVCASQRLRDMTHRNAKQLRASEIHGHQSLHQSPRLKEVSSKINTLLLCTRLSPHVTDVDPRRLIAFRSSVEARLAFLVPRSSLLHSTAARFSTRTRRLRFFATILASVEGRSR